MPSALLGLALLLAPQTSVPPDDPRPAAPVGFKADVAPILVRRCLACHDDNEAQSGLNMSTYAGLRRGGESVGAGILEPGKPEASYLIELIQPDANPRMPDKQDPLPAAEIATLERWVSEGANFDGPSAEQTRIASLVDPLANLPDVPLAVPTSPPITAVAFAPGGAVLAAARGEDVVLFDVDRRTELDTLRGHAGAVNALRFTPDGEMLVAAGGRAGIEGFVAVWDLDARRLRHDLRGHADQVLAADLSPDGRTLATGSYDRTARLWDIESGREIRTLKEHTDAVYGVAFSPDGRSLATASGDRTAKLWNVEDGRKVVSLSDATAEVYAVAFAPDGRTVLVAGVDRSIRAYRWEGDQASLAGSAFAHDAAVLRLVIAPDGKTLLSGGEDRRVKLWDLAGLEPVATLAPQPDWPLALGIDEEGRRLAVGRYDGSLDVIDMASRDVTASLARAPEPVPPEEPAKPELVRNASLNPPSPRGAMRGTTLKVTLTGNGVGRAEAILFPEAGVTAKLLPRNPPEPNTLDAELTIAADARVGVHRFLIRTPLGTPPAQAFAVSASPEAAEAEPNDDPAQATPLRLPATITGAIERPGGVDGYRIEAKAGQELVFRALARPLGSAFHGHLTLLDEGGAAVGESTPSDGGANLDPVLVATIPSDGSYLLRVTDLDLGGSGNHFYRIESDENPFVTSAFPPGLGVRPAASRPISLRGANLGGEVQAVTELRRGEPDVPEIVPLAISGVGASIPRSTDLSLVWAAGQQREESEPNDETDRANDLASPGGISGRIDGPGDSDLYRFEARAGRPVVVELFGRRLGTPIDPVIEILDPQGRPVPRAVLRPVEQTAVQFRDHPSTGRNVRLTWPWDGFALGDTILVGREVSRLHELPRNPDDDSVWWGLGNPRNNTGERIAFLGTTPEHHPMGQPIYKVEVHPSGATFPPGGVPPVTIHHRNDDGGPGVGKDSHLIFDPPSDGTYLVRVEDVRGLGGEDFVYHLVVRDPRPDFRLVLGTETPNVPRGGSAPLPVTIHRLDGFTGPVELDVADLPTGISATRTTVEADQYYAELLLSADPSAGTFPDSNWVVRARARTGASPADAIEHVLDPGGPAGGWITVTPEPNLKVEIRSERVEIRPGERVEIALAIDRRNGFEGRVPIDVRNLPFGVRVLHIGLNGVLVTPDQSERGVFLYCEPWVQPMERSFFAVATCEPAGTSDGSAAVPLVVLPATGDAHDAPGRRTPPSAPAR
jgi:WD40 repeat protein